MTVLCVPYSVEVEARNSRLEDGGWERLRQPCVVVFGITHLRDLSGRGTTRAEKAERNQEPCVVVFGIRPVKTKVYLSTEQDSG